MFDVANNLDSTNPAWDRSKVDSERLWTVRSLNLHPSINIDRAPFFHPEGRCILRTPRASVQPRIDRS